MRLIRFDEPESCTLGVLYFPEALRSWVTLEPPWLDNAVALSCIPCGEYPLRLHNSPHFGECVEVCDVPGRSEILIHPGNYRAETEGCILIGQRIGRAGDGRPAIWQSRDAFKDLMEHFKKYAGSQPMLEIAKGF